MPAVGGGLSPHSPCTRSPSAVRLVDAAPPGAIPGPFAGQQRGPLQAEKGWADRAYAQVECAPAYAAEFRHDRGPMN